MNTENLHNEQPKSKPEFVAELTPHRSLSRSGFMVLMGFISVTCFVSGIMFMVMGAWPVLIFMLVDVLVIWLAFNLNYRSGRIKERVSIARDELIIQQFDAAGRMREHSFNPFWTRFEVNRHEEIGITSMVLRSRDRKLAIGSFLNPEDRESFSKAFSCAIAKVRS